MDKDRHYLTQRETDLARRLAVLLANPEYNDQTRRNRYRELFRVLMDEVPSWELEGEPNREAFLTSLRSAMHSTMPEQPKRCWPFMHRWKFTNRWFVEEDRYAFGVRCSKCKRTKITN